MKYLRVAWTPRRLGPIAEREAEFLGSWGSTWHIDSMGCLGKAKPNGNQ